MWPSLKPSQRVAVAAAIPPQSSSAALLSGWISMAVFHKLMAVIATGALGMAATVDAKFQQATDANGTNAKDVPNSAIAQVTKAGVDGSNTQSILQLKGGELDINNGFAFVQLVVTPGVTASQVSATVLGFDPHYAPASDYNAASVTQVVN